MFNLKTSVTNQLFQILKELNISSVEFKIPQDSSMNMESTLSETEFFEITHRKFSNYYFQISLYTSLVSSMSDLRISYCPGSTSYIQTVENVNFDIILPHIPIWHKELTKELKAEEVKENILRELAKIQTSSLNIDEPFSSYELTDILPKALNDFKTKVLSSNIPAEVKQKLIQGTDEYYQKANKGDVNKQVWFGGFLLFIATTLAEYGLEKFYDSILAYIKSSFHIFPVLAM